ncbi:MAG: hypothetical protein PUE47_09605 [Lachnospiraceae bacterium]|nr:hypothetical protein [Lachnospiraceae bacterium]
MDAFMNSQFSSLPVSALDEFKESVGVVFVYGDETASSWVSVAVLLITGIVHFLAILNMNRKERQL